VTGTVEWLVNHRSLRMSATSLSTVRRHPTRLLVLLVFSSYVALTFVFWGVFVVDRGLPAETGMIELSDVRPGLNGFTYPYDPARRFMSLSFHIAHLLSNGSYLSLHLIFGALILLTGCLGYSITRLLPPRSRLFAYLVGAVSICFGADQGANWAGYTVQRQTTTFALAAVWLLLAAWNRKTPWLLLLVGIFQYLSLWTYEACLLPLLAVPLLLYLHTLRTVRTRFVLYCSAWSIVPIAKLTSLIYHNWILHEQSYEASVLAGNITVRALGYKLVFLVAKGLAFWNWPAYPYSLASGCQAEVLRRAAVPVLAGVAILLLCAFVIRRFEDPDAFHPPLAPLKVILVSLFFLVLTYVPFIMLQGISLLRTQLVAAVPAAAVIIALVFWLDSLVRMRGIVMIVVIGVIAGCGLASGMFQQLELDHDWKGYRKIMKAIVEAAPCVKDDTMIVLVQVPTRISYSLCSNDLAFDPFRDVMWFNSGLQVLYPDTKLAGIYYRSDGSGSESIRFNFADKGAVLDRAGIGLEGNHFGYDHMVAFGFDQDRGAVLLDMFPTTSVPGAAKTETYSPKARITCDVPPARVRHRLNW
jgi:hypothetical protein